MKNTKADDLRGALIDKGFDLLKRIDSSIPPGEAATIVHAVVAALHAATSPPGGLRAIVDPPNPGVARAIIDPPPDPGLQATDPPPDPGRK